MLVLYSITLFLLAAIAEIGGAWLVWQGVREHRSWLWIGVGVIALGLYGFVATLQPNMHFGRILAAYGGVFVAGAVSEPQATVGLVSSADQAHGKGNFRRLVCGERRGHVVAA